MWITADPRVDPEATGGIIYLDCRESRYIIPPGLETPRDSPGGTGK